MTLPIKTAVILVGGSGLRMRPLTNDLPKCMIPLHGKPLIYWTLRWLKENCFEHIVMGVSWHKEVIIDYISKNPMDLKVDFSEHTQEGETGEGFRLAISRYVSDETFLAMNGDELTNLNLQRFVDLHLKENAITTIAVSPMKSPFAILNVKGNDIIDFQEKPLLEDKLVSAGIYVFNQAITEYLPQVGSIEKITFPAISKAGRLKAYRLGKDERWITVNSVNELYAAEAEFSSLRRY
jgi:NDP-sugar pyrophosphorylase family protein